MEVIKTRLPAVNMESLRRPEMVISCATLAGLIGATIYSYKKISDLHKELDDLKMKTASSLAGVKKVEMDYKKLEETVKKVSDHSNSNITELLSRTEDISNDIENIQYALAGIIKFLNKEYNITLETEVPRYGKKKKVRISKQKQESSSEEEEPEPPKRKGKKQPPKKAASSDDENGSEDEGTSSVAKSIQAARAAKKK